MGKGRDLAVQPLPLLFCACHTGRIVRIVIIILPRAQLFEGRLALNPGFFFWRSKAFSRVIFSVVFRASNHQLVDKKN